MTPEEFRLASGVSRETFHSLEWYAHEVLRWNESQNLIGPSESARIWGRHFLDSAQVIDLLEPEETVVSDLGSGAGFPGLVIAIMAPWLTVHLIESDIKKSAFLRHISAHLKLPTRIHTQRLETLECLPGQVVTARGLATLTQLLDWIEPLRRGPQRYIFLKGQTANLELTEAGKYWTIDAELRPSRSHASGQVIILREFTRLTK